MNVRVHAANLSSAFTLDMADNPGNKDHLGDSQQWIKIHPEDMVWMTPVYGVHESKRKDKYNICIQYTPLIDFIWGPYQE